MKASPFAYYQPTSIEQAVIMLADVAQQDGRVIAGGQTLVPALALRFAQPSYLVDINGIEALRRLSVENDRLVVYACVRHSAFHEPVVAGPLGRLLSTVVRHIAHLPIRNRGTFCGSLANADAASEWCLVAATLDAVLTARNMQGERHIAARDYFIGYMTTALAPEDLLVSASLPVLPQGARFGFEEFSRRAGDFAQAMSLAVLELDNGAMAGVRIGVGGVESIPRRIPEAEALLEGKAPTPELIAAAARAAATAVTPTDATDEGRWYQRELTDTVVRRALERALGEAPPGQQQG